MTLELEHTTLIHQYIHNRITLHVHLNSVAALQIQSTNIKIENVHIKMAIMVEVEVELTLKPFFKLYQLCVKETKTE